MPVNCSEIHASKLRTFKYGTADVKAEFLIEHLPETPEVLRIEMKCNVFEYARSLRAMVEE